MEEPGEPDTLPLSLGPHEVHPVVPVPCSHQRETMAPDGQAAVESSGAMFEHRGLLLGDARLEIRVGLLGGEERPFEEGHDLVEETPIAGGLDILLDDVGKPEAIVGDPGPHSPTGRRVPPVLDVAFDELPRGGAEHVLTRHVRPGYRERHHVLKLITKAVGAAGLVERRPRPHTTGERLVEQPAIEQHVHGPVRRRDLYAAQHVIPVLRDGSQGSIRIARPITLDQFARLVAGCRLAEKKHDLAMSPRAYLDHRADGPAGIAPGAAPSRTSASYRGPHSTARP